MKHLAWLLAVLMMYALPGHALADSHHTPRYAHSSTCVVRLSDEDWGGYSQLPCLSGVAMNVSHAGMKVQPAHSVQRQVRFTKRTRFATDSGEGVLDGLVNGDYVCVVYTPQPGTVPALLVVFDPTWNPCGPGRRPHSGDWTASMCKMLGPAWDVADVAVRFIRLESMYFWHLLLLSEVSPLTP